MKWSVSVTSFSHCLAISLASLYSWLCHLSFNLAGTSSESSCSSLSFSHLLWSVSTLVSSCFSSSLSSTSGPISHSPSSCSSCCLANSDWQVLLCSRLFWSPHSLSTKLIFDWTHCFNSFANCYSYTCTILIDTYRRSRNFCVLYRLREACSGSPQ